MLSKKLGFRIFVAHRCSGNLKDVLSDFCALIYRKSLFLCHSFQKKSCKWCLFAVVSTDFLKHDGARHFLLLVCRFRFICAVISLTLASTATSTQPIIVLFFMVLR